MNTWTRNYVLFLGKKLFLKKKQLFFAVSAAKHCIQHGRPTSFQTFCLCIKLLKSLSFKKGARVQLHQMHKCFSSPVFSFLEMTHNYWDQKVKTRKTFFCINDNRVKLRLTVRLGQLAGSVFCEVGNNFGMGIGLSEHKAFDEILAKVNLQLTECCSQVAACSIRILVCQLRVNFRHYLIKRIVLAHAEI